MADIDPTPSLPPSGTAPVPGTEPPVSSGAGVPEAPLNPRPGQASSAPPPGDPLASYREVFAEDPRLLPHLKAHLGADEYAIGRTLTDANGHFQQQLTDGEHQRAKAWGLDNDPVILGYMARQQRERAGMLHTVTDLQAENARLREQTAGYPLRPPASAAPPPGPRTLPQGVDLREQEHQLTQEYFRTTDPERRQRLQYQLDGVRQQLHAVRPGTSSPEFRR